MKEMIINETPVRTSRNFNINNIKVNLDLPKKIRQFDNFSISNTTSKIQVSNDIDIINLKPLTYGVSKELENYNYENSNLNLQINSESKAKKDIQIDFDLDIKNPYLLGNIIIYAQENTKTTAILKLSSKSDIEGFSNVILRTDVKENASLEVIVFNNLNEKSKNLLSIENTIGANANLNYTIIDFGANMSVVNYYSTLKGENSSNDIKSIYLGKNQDILDLNYIVHLIGEKSNTNIEVQGALKDNAHKNFKGTIDFKTGAKKAKGNENEFCTLLSDKAYALALPMLLCSEDDVEGNHSTAAGKVDAKELFYIMSHGFDKKEAMKLIVKARFNDIINSIKSEELKAEILQQIDEILG